MTLIRDEESCKKLLQFGISALRVTHMLLNFQYTISPVAMSYASAGGVISPQRIGWDLVTHPTQRP